MNQEFLKLDSSESWVFMAIKKKKKKKGILNSSRKRCNISTEGTFLMLEKFCFFGLKTRLSFTRVPAGYIEFFLAAQWPVPVS